MKTFHSWQRSAEGFSLLEVLVALAIMVVAFTTLLGTQSGAILMSRRAEQMSTAVHLAREKLSDLELQYRGGLPGNDVDEVHPPAEKPFGDEFSDYGYGLVIRKVIIPVPESILAQNEQSEAISGSAGAISNFLSQAIREVRLRIIWESGAGADQIEIVTHLVDLNANLLGQ